jgi:intracellular multiplication protein IcmP
MRQQQQGGQDNSLDFLWLMVLVIGIVLAIWYFGKGIILTGIIKVRFYELIAMDVVWSGVVDFARMLGWHLPVSQLSEWINYLRSDSVLYSTGIAARVSLFTGNIMRFLVTPCLMLLAFIAYRANVGAKFNTVYQMPILRKANLGDFPHLNALAGTNLVEEDLDQMPWAVTRSPMQFCKEHDLLEEYTKDHEPAVRVLRGKAYRIIVEQLGPLWTTIDKQPMYIQALFAVFAAKGNQDSDGAAALLRQMALSSSGNKIDFSGARSLLRKHYNSKLVARCLGRHAYTTTVMAGMLNLARTDGVLATAEFLWLKKIDRRLWYMLNDVGRQTSAVEVAGPFAHFMVESRLKAALKAPYVETALDALELAIAEIKYDPEIMQ